MSLEPAISELVLERLPVFPLPSTVLFPGTEVPLHVFEPRYRALVRHALEHDRVIGVALLKPGYEEDYLGRPPIHDVLGAGVIVDAELLPDGRYDIVVRGTDRVKVVRELPSPKGFRLFRTRRLDPAAQESCRVAEQTLRALALRLAGAVPDVKEPLSRVLGTVHGVDLADQLACRLIPDPERRQRILEESQGERRLELVIGEVAEVYLKVAPATRTGPLN